jgi:hypothetical protein
MLKEAREDDDQDIGSDEEEEEGHEKQVGEHPLSMKARLYGNPTPFPNEALLEKLSNKLAQEDKEIHDNLRVSISGGPVFKVGETEAP